MQAIDVSDLPEPVARAIEAMVRTLRGQFVKSSTNGSQPHSGGITVRDGAVIGNLSREEIYEDVA